MQSGQEMLEEAVAICRQIAEGLASQAGASQSWEDSVTEIVEKFDEVSGTFFFKTMPSIPVTKTCHHEASTLLELCKAEQWSEFGSALTTMIKSAQTLIEKAGMKGTTLT